MAKSSFYNTRFFSKHSVCTCQSDGLHETNRVKNKLAEKIMNHFVDRVIKFIRKVAQLKFISIKRGEQLQQHAFTSQNQSIFYIYHYHCKDSHTMSHSCPFQENTNTKAFQQGTFTIN